MMNWILGITARLMGGYAILIVAMFGAALLRGRRWRARKERSAQVLPAIREALADYLAGSEDLSRLRQLLEASRADVSAVILEFQSSVSGSARDRLCALCLELALIHEWRDETRSRDATRRRTAFTAIAFACAYEPCRRVAGETLAAALDDRDREMRICAAQALAQFGDSEAAARIFDMALDENLLVRVLLAESLRARALELSAKAIPAALDLSDAASDQARVLAALEIVVAWERALPVSGLAALVDNGQREIRIRALRAMPLVIASGENRSAVLRALGDADADILMAAAAAAGRLQIADAIPLLARCLRSGHAGVSRTAAAALAALPPLGWEELHEFAGRADELMAETAAEALGRIAAAGGA